MPERRHLQTDLPDNVSVRRWFAAYGLFLLAAGVPLVMLIGSHDWATETWWRPGLSIAQRWEGFLRVFELAPRAIKLLGFAIFISLCCTFFPLPANAVVAAIATKNVAVGPDIWTTTLLIAAVGGAASTIANLNDYHLFTWMLRHHHIAKVRHTKIYQGAARWFARGPFSIIVIFNILPIPIDVVRMLATTYRYPRRPFAAANFIGRFVRYAILAFVTYALGREYGWISPVVLLALAALMGTERLITRALRKRSKQRGNAKPETVESTGQEKE